jgi:hypothetical protein
MVTGSGVVTGSPIQQARASRDRGHRQGQVLFRDQHTRNSVSDRCSASNVIHGTFFASGSD